MTMIAVLADTHLPVLRDTAQEASFRWALAHLVALKPDVVIMAGDGTAMGALASARRLRRQLTDTGFPLLLTPGNSDRRAPDEREQTCSELTVRDPVVFPGGIAAVVDTSDGTLPAHEREYLQRVVQQGAGQDIVVATHCPPSDLDPESRQWLTAFLEESPSALFIAGHKHVDQCSTIGACQLSLVRGLDPDKAKGSPPSVTLFKQHGGAWHRRDICFPGGDTQQWPPNRKTSFLHLLGFSCMDHTLQGLRRARSDRVAAVELRARPALTVARGELGEAVAAWRREMGGYLSIHMPDLVWDGSRSEIGGCEQWVCARDLALDLGADAMTVHVPRAPVWAMGSGNAIRKAFSDLLCLHLAPAVRQDMVLSVENLHLERGQEDTPQRGFGCTPEECLAWVRHLREVTGHEKVGLHLDIGHARNNGFLASRFPLGSWYALAGAEITGYHLHQVVATDTGVENHHPIQSLFGPLISLSSFFWAWESGQLRQAPMFLEIRAPGCGWENLEHMRHQIGQG